MCYKGNADRKFHQAIFRIYQMKKIFIIMMSILTISCTASANETKIITDGFTVVLTDKSLDMKINKNESYIGELGEYKVVSGSKDPSNLAYIIEEDGTSKIVKNKIMVKCKKDINCIPSSLKSKLISKNYYEIELNSYDSWIKTIDLLENTEGVVKVAPSFFYGNKISYK